MDTNGRVGTWTSTCLTHSHMHTSYHISSPTKETGWNGLREEVEHSWSDLWGMLPRWEWPSQRREAERQIWVEKQVMVRRKISLIMNLTIWNFRSKFVFVLMRENLKILNRLLSMMTTKSIAAKMHLENNNHVTVWTRKRQAASSVFWCRDWAETFKGRVIEKGHGA